MTTRYKPENSLEDDIFLEGPKGEWKNIQEIRIEVREKDYIWSFPIRCPQWLFRILEKLEV